MGLRKADTHIHNFRVRERPTAAIREVVHEHSEPPI